MQFLAHDTDLSGPMSGDAFTEVLSDVWLPIEVPKVSCNVLKHLPILVSNTFPAYSRTSSYKRPRRNTYINPPAKLAAKYPTIHSPSPSF